MLVSVQRTLCLAIGLTVTTPAFAQAIPANGTLMTDVWVRTGMGTSRPDISNITAAGRAAMEEYDHAADGILKCLIGWGRLNTVSGFPMELIVSENQVTILYEYNHAVRRVYLDQSEFPFDYPPSLVGYSIGHWDEDTLVVETRELLSGWINMEGVAPYTAAAVTTERFSLNADTRRLTVLRTVDDPEYYSGPVTWTTVYQPSDFPVYPYDCTVGSYGSSLGE
jgi:hypothetical protein